MIHPNLSLGAIPDVSTLLTVGVPVTALALGLTGWAIRHRGRARGRDRQKTPSNLAVKVAALAALGCTAYSADTSWRFAADYLDMAGTAERIAMFAAAEFALFATALMARQNLVSRGAPGLPGTLVWLITGVQVIPAYAESGLIGGTVRAFVGPIMAAMLWHQAMGIELRLRTPGATSRGLIATLGREARERILSRLGIAARDRDAAQITRDRATTRAVTLAARLAERTPGQRATWHGRRLTRRLSKAIARAQVGTDPTQRTALLDQLAARRHALSLATAPLPSPWDHDVPVPSPACATVPSLKGVVPEPGPRAGHQVGDRGPQAPHTGTGTSARNDTPVPDNGDRDTTVRDRDNAGTGPRGEAAGTGDRTTATAGRDRSRAVPPEAEGRPATDVAQGTGGTKHEVPGQRTRDAGPSGSDSGTDHTRDRGPSPTNPGTDHTRDRGPSPTNPGTDHTRDRGPSPTNPGTDHTRDRGPSPTNPGTDHTRDRGPSPTNPGTDHTRDRGPSPTNPGTDHTRDRGPTNDAQETVNRLVQQVLPHVPALLKRDGNESVTRVQLREILRRQGLKGGRNDRLSLVLQQLRNDTNTTRRAR
ncbi:hypothetical protein RM572_27920 [Streptomyces sp. DSM 42041]|uniref:DUF2637 domain-containing protein n=1 Tax=Streptomyces hazeniae TaxID=3075538 RepID=A0ABU2P013_9ACTN|nr:hypothetical protein [Streptomyces sp. DSM 42041]MDT0382586.1 hypothetical protein [Streptomyces sp. DSM 42041]